MPRHIGDLGYSMKGPGAFSPSKEHAPNITRTDDSVNKSAHLGCLVRSLILQTLTDDAGKRACITPGVVTAIRNAVVVAELELSDVPVQVLLRSVLIDALHAALEDRERALP